MAAPAQAGHQRLLALRAAEVERRLIDNASLLGALQRVPPRLPALTAALAARVRSDKQALAAAGLARRAAPAPRVPPHEDDRWARPDVRRFRERVGASDVEMFRNFTITAAGRGGARKRAPRGPPPAVNARSASARDVLLLRIPRFIIIRAVDDHDDVEPRSVRPLGAYSECHFVV